MAATQEQNKKCGPVYFWKPDQGHGYLGQWYWSPWTWQGEVYCTAEMWMMVGKARLFGDEDIAKAILEADDPRMQKALGRQVKDFDEKIWDERKYNLMLSYSSSTNLRAADKLRIVEEGNHHKFTISEDAENLRAMLLATGDRELVEASPRDKIWGIGYAEKDAGYKRARWGQNLLGKALMSVRRRLRDEVGHQERCGEND